jgi:hypothetical protein
MPDTHNNADSVRLFPRRVFDAAGDGRRAHGRDHRLVQTKRPPQMGQVETLVNRICGNNVDVAALRFESRLDGTREEEERLE